MCSPNGENATHKPHTLLCIYTLYKIYAHLCNKVNAMNHQFSKKNKLITNLKNESNSLMALVKISSNYIHEWMIDSQDSKLVG